jgi:hypothetical protein
MDDSMIMMISKVEIISTAVVSALFCVIYHFTSRWWKSEFGRTLMAYQLGMTGVLGLSVLQLVIGPRMWITYVGLLVFAMVPLALAGRLWVLIKARGSHTVSKPEE